MCRRHVLVGTRRIRNVIIGKKSFHRARLLWLGANRFLMDRQTSADELILAMIQCVDAENKFRNLRAPATIYCRRA